MEEFFDLFLFSFPSKLFSQLYRNIGGMQCRVVFSTPTFDKYEHSRKAQIVFCPAKKSLLAQRKKNCIKESEQDHVGRLMRTAVNAFVVCFWSV